MKKKKKYITQNTKYKILNTKYKIVQCRGWAVSKQRVTLPNKVFYGTGHCTIYKTQNTLYKIQNTKVECAADWDVSKQMVTLANKVFYSKKYKIQNTKY